MKEKSGLIPDPGLRELPNSEVPINISVMAEASDFKFGKKLGFGKCKYNKITLKDENDRGPRLWSSQKCGVSL